MAFAIVTDSSCALPRTPDGSRAVGADGTAPIHVLQHAVATTAGRTTTSQPSADAIRATIARAIDSGADQVVIAVLSANVSGTAAAVQHVAEEFEHVAAVIDTRCIGGALGLAVRAGSRAPDARAAAARIREVAAKSHTGLVVADLKPLVSGGRLSAPTAAIGSALGILPVIEVRDGSLALAEVVHGRKRGTARLITRSVAHVVGRGRRVREAVAPVDLVIHCAAGDGFAADVDAAFDAAGINVRERLETALPDVLEAHTGPRYWGIALGPAL